MALPALYELASLLSTLSAGRYIKWYDQIDTATGDLDYTGAPTSGKGCPMGVLENGVIKALGRVQLRDDASFRTCRVTLTTLVASQTWTVTIGGNAVAYLAGALDTWADIIDGLVLALPGVPAADALVTFTASDADGDGTDDTLLVRGKAETDYTIDISATGGAAMACVGEYTSAKARIYANHRGTAVSSTRSAPESNSFVYVPGTLYDGVAGNNPLITYRGIMDRYDVAGIQRMYWELYDMTYPADGASVTHEFSYVGWGVATQEETAG